MADTGGLPDVGQLYTAHYESMFKVAAAILASAGRSTADPLDIVHDVFDQIMAKPPTQSIDSWEAYLVRITKNRTLDHLKSHDQKRTAPTTDGTTEAMERIAGDSGALSGERWFAGELTDDRAIRRLRAEVARSHLEVALSKLGPEQRDVVTRRIGGETITEIADARGTSPANISQLLRKGMATISGELEQFDVSDADIGAVQPTRKTRRKP